MSPEHLRQIEALYHAAREGTAEERAALLAQADPELRREVESLLIEPAGGEFLERPAIQNGPELVEDATHELSGKYRALHEHSKQLLDEAETILRRAKTAATRR